MPTLPVHIEPDFIQRPQAVADRDGHKADNIVDEALNKRLQWQEMQMLLWNETEEAITEADAGETIEADKVFSWLDTWGQPKEHLS